MNQRLQDKWPVIDALAASLGAKRAARLKWRTRGNVPFRWQVLLIARSGGVLKADDFLPENERAA